MKQPNPVAAQLRALVEAYKTHQDPRLLIEQTLDLCEWLEQPANDLELRLRRANELARETRVEQPRSRDYATCVLIPAVAK